MNKFFLAVAILFLACTALLLWATQGQKAQNSTNVVAESGGEEGVYETKADIGGAFALTDQHGAERKDTEFRGRMMLVFFGFTHCPDICPVTVATFSSLMELLGDKADQVAPVFITVDPARDTPEVMKDYLSNFDKRIIGLSGSTEQIRSAADAYKVYYAKAKQEEPKDVEPMMTHRPPGAEDNYFVDHSGYIYLMDTHGNYVEHFRYNASEQELADAIKPYLK